MGGTWDAYDMDPCYGGCGGVAIITKKLKNINNGKIINISFCNGYCKNSRSVCVFQDHENPENITQFYANPEEWKEVVENEENLI